MNHRILKVSWSASTWMLPGLTEYLDTWATAVSVHVCTFILSLSNTPFHVKCESEDLVRFAAILKRDFPTKFDPLMEEEPWWYSDAVSFFFFWKKALHPIRRIPAFRGQVSKWAKKKVKTLLICHTFLIWFWHLMFLTGARPLAAPILIQCWWHPASCSARKKKIAKLEVFCTWPVKMFHLVCYSQTKSVSATESIINNPGSISEATKIKTSSLGNETLQICFTWRAAWCWMSKKWTLFFFGEQTVFERKGASILHNKNKGLVQSEIHIYTCPLQK